MSQQRVLAYKQHRIRECRKYHIMAVTRRKSTVCVEQFTHFESVYRNDRISFVSVLVVIFIRYGTPNTAYRLHPVANALHYRVPPLCVHVYQKKGDPRGRNDS